MQAIPLEDDTRPRVVVGVDGSGPSVAALRHAHRMAQALHVPLVAVHIWDCPPEYRSFAPAGWSPHDAASYETLRDAWERAFGHETPEDVELVIGEGPVARLLINASRGASMLVVGCRERGAFTRAVGGSVSAVCAAHAHCPVLVHHQDGVLRPGRPWREWAKDGGALTP